MVINIVNFKFEMCDETAGKSPCGRYHIHTGTRSLEVYSGGVMQCLNKIVSQCGGVINHLGMIFLNVSSLMNWIATMFNFPIKDLMR